MMNSSELVTVPLGSVTVIFPVTVPFATTAVILVSETIANDAAFVPPNLTAVAPESASPLIVTLVPHGPLPGLNELISGLATVKLVVLWLVPFGVVTEMGPVVALLGTVAVIRLELTTVNCAEALLNRTEVAPVRLFPLIVTDVPAGTLVGENEVISGVPGTVNFVELVAVPAGVVTPMNPVVVPLATVAVSCVTLTTVKLEAFVRLNFTAVVPLRLVPLIVTTVPGAPLVGENELIVGLPTAPTVKLLELVAVPAGVVTWIGPLCVPLATVARICVLESTVKLAAALLPIFTAVAPVKFVPVIVTTVPTGPDVGENEVIDGAEVAVTTKLSALVAVPSGVVTEIDPVWAFDF